VNGIPANLRNRFPIGTCDMAGMKKHGFSLIEVLVAILIFSMSLLALVPLMSTSTSIDRENYLNVTARAMAADILDSLMGGMKEAEAEILFGGNPSTVTDQGVVITRSWLLSDAGNLDNIAVTVRYAYKGQTKIFMLTAQKAR
jgi:prepilin-type N-terminal cleavage/methylation domain-containing protein